MVILVYRFFAKTLPFLLLIHFSQCVFADNASHNPSQSTLWKVQKPGVDPSYLLGTVHVSDPRVTTFPVEILTAMRNTRFLMVEVKMDENSQQEVFKSMFTNEVALDRLITHDEILRVKKALQHQPLLAARVEFLKPWAAMILLSIPKEESGLAMDALLQERFTQQNKPVFQLESIAEQLNLFDKISLANQVALLKETIRHLPEMDHLMDQVLELYLQGDLDGLLDLNLEYLHESGNRALDDLMYELIQVRNKRMFLRALTRLELGNTMVAVGALHLPGDEGLIHLLTEYGFSVTPIALTR